MEVAVYARARAGGLEQLGLRRLVRSLAGAVQEARQRGSRQLGLGRSVRWATSSRAPLCAARLAYRGSKTNGSGTNAGFGGRAGRALCAKSVRRPRVRAVSMNTQSLHTIVGVDVAESSSTCAVPATSYWAELLVKTHRFKEPFEFCERVRHSSPSAWLGTSS